MADRKQSKDGTKDSEFFVEDQDEGIEHNKAGGDVASNIGARDEEKRAYEEPAGVTRPTAEDKAKDSNT